MGLWDEIVESLPDMIRTDSDTSNLDLDDEDSWADYAHEWADGSEYVIYHHHVLGLWSDSYNGVFGYEGEAWDIAGDSRDIMSVMAACVYLALRDAIMSAIEMVARERSLVA